MIPQGADGLFVYGTLRTGGRNQHWIRKTHPEGVTGAYAPGRLFHLPAVGFPALIEVAEPNELPPGPGWVVGEFVGYEDDQVLESAAQDLDALEDVDGGLFERRLVPVILDSGHRYLAWAYVFPEDRLPRLEREAIELLSGDWRDYLAR
jgi:gamma-glutamylcyclotransferase (GGCT)/AIG2-like uncharacterized protein YtfP